MSVLSGSKAIPADGMGTVVDAYRIEGAELE
jgi:hypothetical protein